MAQAVLVRRTGGPEVLTYEEHDPGPPAAGAVRVRVTAAGVNFIDVYFRTGLYPAELPIVLGREGAGVVEAIGAGVDGLAPGARVCWAMVPGSYAQAANIPADKLVAVPDGVSDEAAAGAMLQGMTAHYLVHSTRPASSGDMALVHAAAGGVGLLLIQMLSRLGVRVAGTCSTDEKAELVQAAGADRVINYTTEDFAERVAEWTDGRGVDVVYDSVGASTFEGSVQSLRPRGMMVLFGQSSGPVPPFDLNRLNPLGSVYVTRPSLIHYIQDRAELELRARAVLDAVADGSLKIRIGRQFPLADAADAHRALEGRQTAGKIVLTC
ncbi:MAG: quinone oxidoreductase [Vicinamibacterales bacterium]|jgi:NADPH2:quinone reductase|nr:NADPH:quinone reductase [Acidobacteriota bacterium]MDP7295411.1 quinone oxidoreductase [Vicinamibacterales bacterium]MDP7471999.1 quinone oxidoreductase [Vicinamibacterales bacterium]MDP7672714.1 quinone oxidoreductase [Vicinamibacterales bacterium]HJO37384.1 quinone oxidoreductase [Vicinamibacterales bacterium]|tara:strand:+ start:5647 stop:6618 length:972 start_codon:yes stop_codon:yes gene_type:complete